MKLKYILDSYGNFALFSPSNTHADIAKGFYNPPISAGFCYVRQNINDLNHPPILIECFGESISLKLQSRTEDSKIITDKLNNQYE